MTYSVLRDDARNVLNVNGEQVCGEKRNITVSSTSDLSDEWYTTDACKKKEGNWDVVDVIRSSSYSRPTYVPRTVIVIRDHYYYHYYLGTYLVALLQSV